MKRILLWQMLFALAAPAADFEAVSIKPSPPVARGSGYNLTRGRLQGKNQALRDIVQFAWGVREYQVHGGPAWAGSDHYEIIATFPGETTDGEHSLMLQRMLADRFGLVVHKESKEVPGYALVVGRNEAGFKRAASDEHSLVMGRSADTGHRTLTATSASTADLARILAYTLGQPVGDRTGLEGKYDFASGAPTRLPRRSASPVNHQSRTRKPAPRSSPRFRVWG